MANNEREFIVTPWEVRGEVDYDKLIREFINRIRLLRNCNLNQLVSWILCI